MTICFSGHRPNGLCKYDIKKYQKFVEKLTGQIRSMDSGDEMTFISGGAQGMDQLSFWAVDNYKNSLPENERSRIKNVVYAPFPGQSDIWPEKSLFGKEQYAAMMNTADEVKFSADTRPNNKSDIVKTLMKRNHDMVDNSDAVIALYESDNWHDPNTPSGTAECMRYAITHGKKVIQLMQTITADGLDFSDVRISTEDQKTVDRKPASKYDSTPPGVTNMKAGHSCYHQYDDIEL